MVKYIFNPILNGDLWYGHLKHAGEEWMVMVLAFLVSGNVMEVELRLCDWWLVCSAKDQGEMHFKSHFKWW